MKLFKDLENKLNLENYQENSNRKENMMSGAKGTMQIVRIRPALNGWIVEVGCATFVAIEKEVMINEISRYIDQPREVMAGHLRAQVNEGTYSPDEATREALGVLPGTDRSIRAEPSPPLEAVETATSDREA